MDMTRLLRFACGALATCLFAACDQKKESNPDQAEGNPPAVEPAAPEPAPPKPVPPKPAPPEVPGRAALAKELAGLMESFGKAVAAVTDRPSWQPAKAELAEIKTRVTAITAELQKLPQPTPQERQAFVADMKLNEDNLEKALGDKEQFMQRLSEDVRQELMTAAGEFSTTMGQAQNALYGTATR